VNARTRPSNERASSEGSGGFDVMKWWLRSRDGIDEIQDRDLTRSCSSKDGYRSEAEARAHAAMNGLSGKLFTYHCVYCELWHLTRRQPNA
jgi:hypothetical protein